jgi:Flp pilus assembly protein TadG
MLLTPNRPLHRRRGSVVVLVTVSLIAIVGFAAIVIDGCVLYNDREQIQKTADAAALAAAVDLFTKWNTNAGTDPAGTAATSAKTTATALGYTNGGNATVTVNIPPATGPFAGKSGYAEVIIQYSQRRYFSSIWGGGTVPVQARSVARGMYLPGNYGLIILDPTLQAPCEIDGNLTIQNGGAIQVNSTAVDPNDQPLTGACYVAATATLNCGTINVAGSLNNLGTVNYTPGGTGLHEGAPAISDPLINIPEPVPSGTNYGNVTCAGNYTLHPGIYSQISVSNNANVTMLPGIYYLSSGGNGIKVGTAGTMTGSGVMIYNAAGDKLDFKQSGPITLTPPTSGPYQGISIWIPRTTTQEVHIESISNITLAGTLYAHAGEFDIRPDGANVTHYIGNYICDQFEAGQGYSSNGKSNGQIIINPGNAAPTQRAVQLVE